MAEKRTVRGEHGPLTFMDHTDHGFTIQDIKAWRATESQAGRPGSLRDFYSSHGYCIECLAQGVQMIGWSPPIGSEEILAAKELFLEELPVYRVCPNCGGTGKSSPEENGSRS